MTSPNKRHHVFVAHGDRIIPPFGWGAVEQIIWQYSTRLRSRGISVHVINRRKYGAILEVLKLSLKGEADIVYCHAEKPVKILTMIAKWRKFLLISTTHNPMTPERPDAEALKALGRCCHAPFHFVGREDIVPLIHARNPSAICVLQFNAVEIKDFKTSPVGNGKAICVGRIQERKRQNETAHLLEGTGLACDFIGPFMGDVVISDELRKQMRGEWNRETIHGRLCDYSCLILLSKSERQPLVVSEALAAGIPVVVSPDAAWNLDATKPYIFVVGSDNEVANAVTEAIAVRDRFTAEIRKYAEDSFDYEVLIDDYLSQVEEWLTPKKVH